MELKDLKKELYRLCKETNTSKDGIDYLVSYYINSLGWTEEQAVGYAIGLFHNGTIATIKFFNKSGKEH